MENLFVFVLVAAVILFIVGQWFFLSIKNATDVCSGCQQNCESCPLG